MKKILSILVAMSFVMTSFAQNLSRCDGEQVVFFRLPEDRIWWPDVRAHVFYSGGNITAWPGQVMEYLGNRHYRIVFTGRTIDGTWDIIFNSTTYADPPDDAWHRQRINGVAAGGIYTHGSTTAERFVLAGCTSTAVLCEGTQAIFFRNDANWDNVRIHIWGSEEDNTDWGGVGGVTMIPIGDNYYQYIAEGTIDYAWTILISNGGSDVANQRTGNIHNVVNGAIFLPNGNIVQTLQPEDCSALPLSFLPSSTPATNDNADGTITVAITGGVPPFTIRVSGVNLTDDVIVNDVPATPPMLIENIPAGSYTVRVTDNETGDETENITVSINCTGTFASNENAVNRSIRDIAVLSDSLVITLDPIDLSVCILQNFTPGDPLFLYPFYVFYYEWWSATSSQYNAEEDWGDEDFPMVWDSERNVYTFTIPHIGRFFDYQTGNRAWRPVGMGFHFYGAGQEGSRLRVGPSTEEAHTNFWLYMRRDYALSLWIDGGNLNYYVGESVPFEYEKLLSWNGETTNWFRDSTSLKRYEIELIRDGNVVDVVLANVVFDRGRYYRAFGLPNAGNFVFTARAVTPGSYRMASNPWAAENPLVSHNVIAHNPVVTLTADSASIYEGNSMRVVASVPFAHPTAEIVVILNIVGTDFTGTGTITIPTGQTSAYTTLTAFDDNTKNINPQRQVTIGGTASSTQLSEITFSVTSDDVFIRDIDYNCENPNVPAISISNICTGATNVTFAVTNTADYTTPTFTLWTASTLGTELTTEFDAPTLTITPENPFTANTTFYLQVQDNSRPMGCHISARTPINVVVVQAPNDFDTLMTPTHTGQSTGRILFTAGSRGIGPFNITLYDEANVEVDTELGVVASEEFTGLAAGTYRAIITATGNPTSCQTYEITDIVISISECVETPTQPQLTVETTCYGIGTTLTITNWTSGITYELRNSAHVAQTGIEQNNGVLTIPNNLAIGAFTLVAIDASLPDGCRVSAPIHALTVHGNPTGATAVMHQQSAPHASSGIILVTAGNNGAVPFSVVLRDSEAAQVGTTQSIAAHSGTTQFTGIPVGNFTIEITDNNGCMHTSLPVEITNCTPPVAPIVPNVSACVGETATVTISNFDNSLFTYALHRFPDGELIHVITSAEFQSPEVAATATYLVRRTVVGQAAPGCESGQTQVTVTANQLPVFSAIPTHTFCADGSIAVTVTNGSGPFSVVIGDSTTNDVALNSEILITGLAPARYPISVTNSNGCVSRDTIEIERLPCIELSNQEAFLVPQAIQGLVALDESLSIMLIPSLLSPCVCLAPGQDLYVRPFYRFRRSPSGTEYLSVDFADWGEMLPDFRMTYENGVYEFTIENIFELLRTGTSNYSGGSPFADWMAERPIIMGFHFFYSDGNGGFSVIRTSTDLTNHGYFEVGLTQDFALSLWVHQQSGRTTEGVRNYYVKESVRFKYDRLLRFDNTWSIDRDTLKTYSIQLLKDSDTVDILHWNVAPFDRGEYIRYHELTEAGTFVFTAEAIGMGGVNRMAHDVWADTALFHTIRAHTPIVTLSANRETVVEGDTIIVTATVPFAHPDSTIRVYLLLDSDDLIGTEATLIIPAGQTSAFVILTAVDDDEEIASRFTTIDVTSITGLTGVDFTLYKTINVEILDAGSCLPPATPIVTDDVIVCSGTNLATFTVTNYAVYGTPTFTLWTASTGGEEITLTSTTPGVFNFTYTPTFTANMTFYVQVQDTDVADECNVSERTAVNIIVTRTPFGFKYNPYFASIGMSDGGIEFTTGPNQYGLPPFTITIDGRTIMVDEFGFADFDSLAAGTYNAIITALRNPEGCRTYTILNILVEESPCDFPATPQLTAANVCEGFDEITIEITNHQAGITYRLFFGTTMVLDSITADAENRINIPTQVAGVYYLRAVNLALEDECRVSQHPVRVLNVFSAPTAPIVDFVAEIPVGETVEVTIENFNANYDYALYIENELVTSVSITSETFTTPVITEDITFTLRKISRVTTIPAECNFSTTDIAIVATDTGGTDPTPPAVITFTPADGTEVYVGDTITFTAIGNAYTVAMRLYINDTRVHTVSTNTKSFEWIATTAEEHTFHVVALNKVDDSDTSDVRTFIVRTGTSIVETNDVRLIVSPNPVTDILHIENTTDELLTVEIYTLSGVRVATFINVQNTIDVGHLPSGTYLLRIGTRVVRIVKQ
ncbi:MAG: T9SS type A sorting domain-containing protein [Bacteroidales bacterium]|nr:T9SS type A sorting domain-containing protein [Bacteroidales bacterium]